MGYSLLMRDLELFRRLQDGPIGPELAGDLHALGAWPLHRRLAWLGLIVPIVEHEDPQLRFAALTALAGARGMEAMRAIVSALDDEELAVRLTAVRALQRSVADAQPWRMVHALFHPRPDVRKAALAVRLHRDLDPLRFCLFADPACRPVLLDEELRPGGAVQLFQFIAAGVVSSEQARPFVQRLDLTELRPWLQAKPQRSPEAILRLLAGGPPEGRDVLDLWLGVFWDDSEASWRGMTRIRHMLLSEAGEPYRDRAQASVLAQGRQGRSLPGPAAAMAAVLSPACLLLPGWEAEAVRAGLRGLSEDRERLSKLSNARVRELLDSPVLRGPTGVLDPVGVAAVLGLARSPLPLLLGHLGVEPVLEAFVLDPEGAARLLALPDEVRMGSGVLLAALRGREPELLIRVLAWSVFHRAADRTELIQALEPPQALALLWRLVDILDSGPLDLPSNKRERVAQIIGQKLVPRLKVRRLPIVGLTPPPLLVFRFLEELAVRRGRRHGRVLLHNTLASLCQALRPGVLAQILLDLEPPALTGVLAAVDEASGIPASWVEVLAKTLQHHGHSEVRAWATGALSYETSTAPSATGDPKALSRKQAKAITACDDDDLAAVVSAWLGVTSTGLAKALAARDTGPGACVEVCAALLGCYDEPLLVARQFERFRGDEPSWWKKLDLAMVLHWEGHEQLPGFGHAWLWRWDRHALTLAHTVAEAGVVHSLRWALSLPSVPLRNELWAAVARAFALWRYRDPERLRSLHDADLLELLVDLLDTDLGFPAARMIARLHAAGAAPSVYASMCSTLVELLPSMAEDVRFELRALVRAEGVALPSRPPRALGREAPGDLLARIAQSDDLDWLELCCRRVEPAIAQEAALRLVTLGEPGQAQLARVLLALPRAPCFVALAESVTLWSEGPALRAVRDGVMSREPEDRFRLALPLGDRGEARWCAVCVDALLEPGPVGWLLVADWQRLLRLRGDELALAMELAASAHPHAYTRAVHRLLEAEPRVVADALVTFLEADHERHIGLRLRVAAQLADLGDARGFPLLLTQAVEAEQTVGWDFPQQEQLDAAIAGVLAVGGGLEKSLLVALARRKDRSLAVSWGRLLSSLLHPGARKIAAEQASSAVLSRRRHKLDAVAEVFAWGVRRGMELRGRRFRVHMTSGQGELGYTRLTGTTIHVSPLPLLKGDRRGRVVVEGLILHEIGHHLYHAGRAGRRGWAQAEKERLHPLLNLVADEHLERRLRAYDRAYGDRLKALASFAFQHSPRELEVIRLVQVLHAQTFAVLSSTRLELGWQKQCVRIGSGHLLRALERNGDSFARFVRALRMGLGNRHRDPKVDQGLALFRGSFKDSSMSELLVIARELRRIFGASADLAGICGGHEGLGGDARDQDVHGDRITDREVQREVERILEPPRKQGRSAPGKPGALQVNVGPDQSFNPITTVRPLPYDPAGRRALGAQVARHARRMRGYLEELGLRLEPQRMRMRGSRFDRTRARAVVLRGDPRMLVARELQPRTDLFMGIAVDCSGSMASGGCMHRAKLFASLLAESAVGLRGVDLRVIGFTDRTIYDAGDADRCAVSALPIEGGNNDAAGLHHLAGLALASPRRAKLLVMISDGLPTECSTQALTALVKRLERRGLCVAQVAVRPLSERCFTHYVELDEDNVDVAVRRFGTIIARLVRRAISA
jgi:hypothetical protein